MNPEIQGKCNNSSIPIQNTLNYNKNVDKFMSKSFKNGQYYGQFNRD